MYKIALISGNTVQHVGVYEIVPQFAPPLVTVDITDYEGEVKEGYIYDAENGVFTESTTPVPEEPVTPNPEPNQPELESQPTLEEMQAQTLLNTEYLVIMSELWNL